MRLRPVVPRLLAADDPPKARHGVYDPALVRRHTRIHQRQAARQGVCAIARLAAEPPQLQLIAHIRQLVWATPSRHLLTGIGANLNWLNDRADRLVNGDTKTAHRDPCPDCGLRTLVAYF